MRAGSARLKVSYISGLFYLFASDLIFVVMFALKCNSWKMVFLRCCFYADETIEGGERG